MRLFFIWRFVCASGPISPSNVPFGWANDPNRAVSDPTTYSNAPFRRSNVRIHPNLVNSSPSELLKSLEESAKKEQFSLLCEWPNFALE